MSTAESSVPPIGVSDTKPIESTSAVPVDAEPIKQTIEMFQKENEKQDATDAAVPENTTATTMEKSATAPVTGSATSSNQPTWPAFGDDHPLAKILEQLPKLLEESGYGEVYGIPLKPKTKGKADFHTLLILQKFLRANSNDVSKASEQLLSTLKWRKEFDPIKAVGEKFEKKKFDGLGYVSVIDGSVVTWNIYGAVKDYGVTFVPVEEFLRWRIALMELGVSKLKLNEATAPIPDNGAGVDPYQGIQIHDYLNVSFLRMDPRAKVASRKTIELLGAHYPETLSRKFFVNVPLVMQWMFSAMKLFVSKNTTGKFAVLGYGTYVSAELGTKNAPKVYGGEGAGLAEIGEQLALE